MRAVVAVLTLAMLNGCAGSFEEARLVQHGSAASKVSTPIRDNAYCDALDKKRLRSGFFAKVLGGLAGAAGLSAIPVKNETAQDSFLVGAAVSGVVASGFVYLSEETSSEWVKNCEP